MHSDQQPEVEDEETRELTDDELDDVAGGTSVYMGTGKPLGLDS